MAGNKKQVKTPRFQQKITVDKSGRVRIGGRFASKRQLGGIKAARTRKGLTTVIPKGPSKTDASKRRSLTSKRAARTRKLRATGVRFVSDRTTSIQGLRFVSFDIDAPTQEIIQAAIDEAKRKAKGRLLVYPVIDVTDDDDEDFTVSNNKGFFRNVNADDITQQLIVDFADLESKYNIATVERYSLVFTLPG